LVAFGVLDHFTHRKLYNKKKGKRVVDIRILCF